MIRPALRTSVVAVAFALLAAACATEAPESANAARGAVFTAPGYPERLIGQHEQHVQGVPAKLHSAAAESLPAQRSVFYDLDRYDVKAEFRPAIEAHARYLRQHAGARVTVQGNGDERGSREYNLALGQRRAEGVRQLMRVSGAADHQIETVSFGEEKPKALGHDEAAWAQNRRSDLAYDRAD